VRRRTFIKLLAVRWGFAAMVSVAIVVGVVTAATVAPPEDIPSIAMRAVPVYRVEVGSAVFLGLYLATMALFLAMHNRGFTEIGTGGVRAQGLAAENDAEFEEVLIDLIGEVGDLREERQVDVREKA
jgi:hypothetical protein